jgi:hypothetical protein
LQRLNPRRREAATPVCFKFIEALPGYGQSLMREPRRRFDLASAVRMVARRHLTRFRNAGRSLGCVPGTAVVSHERRLWFDRTVTGLLSLSMRLIPDAPVTLEVRREGGEVIVEASCPSAELPVRGHRNPGLARLTWAREEWLLDLWLWRAMATAGGARLTLMHDDLGPVGIRLFLRG